MALSKPAPGDDFLSCPICTETFKTPKILPCFHTFCQQCIHEFIVSMGSKSESRISEFKCSVCKTVVIPSDIQMDVTEWASGLQNNETMSMMIAMQKDGNRQECHACTRNDEQSDAKVWCKECEEALCEKCTTMHQRMKLSCQHVVVPIDDIGQKMTGIDLRAISDKCPKHTPRLIEAYCGEHRELCCVLCLTTTHRACSNVKVIDAVFESSDVSFENTLVNIKNATEKLIDLRERENAEFNNSVENTKQDTTKMVKALKCKIDELFDAFVKELHMFQDEQNTQEDVRIRLLKQLLQNVNHCIEISKSVKEFGTKPQFFAYVEKTTEQLTSSMTELLPASKCSACLFVTLEKDELFQKLETAEQIGKLSTADVQLDRQFSDLGALRCFNPNFDEINLTFIRNYRFPGSNLSCGICLDGKHLIVGDYSAEGLHIFLRENGQIVNTTSIGSKVKRLCLDTVNKQLFISCFGKTLVKAEISGSNIENPTKITFSHTEYYGDVCILNELVFVSMDDQIRSFRSTINPNEENTMTICFKTNTHCQSPGLNSIIVKKDGEQQLLVYNSKNSEIKCSTTDGKEIFCFKDDAVRSPDCLCVLPSGLILVVDRTNNGSLHVVSPDGMKGRILLGRFKNINIPKDIWLDMNGRIIYICGGEYVESYSIL